MFRFSIRELMLITAIVGLVAGWLLDRSRINTRLANELEWRSKLERVRDIDELEKQVQFNFFGAQYDTPGKIWLERPKEE